MSYFGILKNDFKKAYPTIAITISFIVLCIIGAIWIGWGLLIMEGAPSSGFGTYTIIALCVAPLGMLLIWLHNALERHWNG